MDIKIVDNNLIKKRVLDGIESKDLPLYYDRSTLGYECMPYFVTSSINNRENKSNETYKIGI
tara:strand:- start:376 stop:561 length:186 start_codon:yes stop_codon:yes gene_type:complete